MVGESSALLVIFSLPVIRSALFGAKIRSNVAVCPGAIVARLSYLPTLTSIPATDTSEITKLELPLFWSVIYWTEG